jgi:hypothetical protein
MELFVMHRNWGLVGRLMVYFMERVMNGRIKEAGHEYVV